jgi:cephalosporin-C deacetylase-like acetyl esterase
MDMPNPPEPFASLVDEMWAGKKVEDAIHDPDADQTVRDLDEAQSWLEHAISYFDTGKSSGGAFAYAYSALYNNAVSVHASLVMLSRVARQLSGTNLEKFQQDEIYGFQGRLGQLYSETLRLLGLVVRGSELFG